MKQVAGISIAYYNHLVAQSLLKYARIPCILIRNKRITHFHSSLSDVNRLNNQDVIYLKIDQNPQFMVIIEKVEFNPVNEQPIHFTFFAVG